MKANPESKAFPLLVFGAGAATHEALETTKLAAQAVQVVADVHVVHEAEQAWQAACDVAYPGMQRTQFEVVLWSKQLVIPVPVAQTPVAFK